MSAYLKSPLAMLVIVCAGLALAGTVAGGIHYYAVDLPVQQALSVPENSAGTEIGGCMEECREGHTAACIACGGSPGGSKK